MFQMNPSVVFAHHQFHMCSQKKNVACGHVHFFSALLLIFTLLVAIAFLIFLPPLKKCSCCFFQRNQSPLHFTLALATILDKINEKPKAPLPPKSRMGKWSVFALRTASSLIWRGRGDGLILFCPRLYLLLGYPRQRI